MINPRTARRLKLAVAAVVVIKLALGSGRQVWQPSKWFGPQGVG